MVFFTEICIMFLIKHMLIICNKLAIKLRSFYKHGIFSSVVVSPTQTGLKTGRICVDWRDWKCGARTGVMAPCASQFCPLYVSSFWPQYSRNSAAHPYTASSRGKQYVPRGAQKDFPRTSRWTPWISLVQIRSHAHSWTILTHGDHSWAGQRASFSDTYSWYVRDGRHP